MIKRRGRKGFRWTNRVAWWLDGRVPVGVSEAWFRLDRKLNNWPRPSGSLVVARDSNGVTVVGLVDDPPPVFVDNEGNIHGRD